MRTKNFLNRLAQKSIDSAGTITNGPVIFGDSAADKDIRGFFAFDISTLKGKNLISATLKLIEPNITETINFKDNMQIPKILCYNLVYSRIKTCRMD